MFKQYEEQLTECRLFAGINSEELNLMLQCLNPAVSSYQKNETGYYCH